MYVCQLAAGSQGLLVFKQGPLGGAQVWNWEIALPPGGCRGGAQQQGFFMLPGL